MLKILSRKIYRKSQGKLRFFQNLGKKTQWKVTLKSL